jgi:hypothetical protein
LGFSDSAPFSGLVRFSLAFGSTELARLSCKNVLRKCTDSFHHTFWDLQSSFVASVSASPAKPLFVFSFGRFFAVAVFFINPQNKYLPFASTQITITTMRASLVECYLLFPFFHHPFRFSDAGRAKKRERESNSIENAH